MSDKLKSLVFVAVVAVSCGGAVGQTDAGSAAGVGGASSGAGNFAGTGGGACFAPCGYPTGDDIDCRGAMGLDLDGGCISVPTDGLPCWRGVGTCSSGVCVAPPGACEQSPPRGAWIACSTDNDCDDGNPCTIGDCPEPGCLPCHQVPMADGTVCGDGKSCQGGACCSP